LISLKLESLEKPEFDYNTKVTSLLLSKADATKIKNIIRDGRLRYPFTKVIEAYSGGADASEPKHTPNKEFHSGKFEEARHSAPIQDDAWGAEATGKKADCQAKEGYIPQAKWPDSDDEKEERKENS
jgi:hypothetical protein